MSRTKLPPMQNTRVFMLGGFPLVENQIPSATLINWALPRKCMAILFMVLALGYLNPVFSQELSVKRVLVLHGVWSHDTWETTFDRAISNSLNQSTDYTIEMSSRYLGLDTLSNPQARINLENEIRTEIAAQSIDLIVAVLPAATQFIADLEGIAEVPQIRVAPDPNSILSDLAKDNVFFVISTARENIESTLNQMLALRPQTRKIEIIAGVSQTDTVYLTMARNVLAESTIKTEIEFHVGEQPSSLREHLENLTENESILLLPYESYGAEASPVPLGYDAVLAEASAAPIFGIYDSNMGSGIVGGQLSSSAAIASFTAELALDLLAGATPEQQIVISSGTPTYDARQVQKWGLDLDQLNTPYDLRYQTSSLWEERPTLVITGGSLILLFALLIFVQAYWLRKSKASELLLKSVNVMAIKNREKYRFLADNSLDVIWTWDEVEENFFYCSPSILKLSGFSEDEFTSLPITELFTKKSIELIKNSLNSHNRMLANIEVEQITKSGKTAWCEIVAQYNQEESSSFKGWVAVSRNITERRAMQKERARLEGHVREAQKFDSLGTLAGGIAHDMNNTLTVILGAAELLKSETVTDENQQAKRLLASIINASGTAKNLVNQILTFSRRKTTERSPINFSQTLIDAFGLIKSGIPNSVNLDFKLDDADIFILGDETQSKQLLINLATNAFEALKRGQGNIEICLRQVNLNSPRVHRHGAVPAGNYALLTVRDDGIGMSDAKTDRIFDPFYTDKKQGTGLGLAIVYGVTMECKGAIDVESSLDGGTLFSIYLPLVSADQSAHQLETNPDVKLEPQILNIAVIDDKEEILEICALMITHLGHRCTCYSEAEAAIKAFGQAELMPDLLITDYSMPGLSGEELIQTLIETFPSLPVIVSTGYGEGLSRFEDNHSLVKATLPKPYNLSQLRETISDVMAPLATDELII